jgi:hypothetical protein
MFSPGREQSNQNRWDEKRSIPAQRDSNAAHSRKQIAKSVVSVGELCQENADSAWPKKHGGKHHQAGKFWYRFSAQPRRMRPAKRPRTSGQNKLLPGGARQNFHFLKWLESAPTWFDTIPQRIATDQKRSGGLRVPGDAGQLFLAGLPLGAGKDARGDFDEPRSELEYGSGVPRVTVAGAVFADVECVGHAGE